MSGVSVIIPAFRAEATIARAVASALAENPFEILVIADDGADYAAVLARGGIGDDRVRHGSTGRIGAGPARARNLGRDLARGEFLAWLDADDAFLPGRLAALVPLAASHGASADNVRVIDDGTGTVLQYLFPEDRPFLKDDPFREDGLPPKDSLPRRLDAEAFLATAVPVMAVVRRALELSWDEDLPILLGDDVAYNLRLIDRLGPLPVTRRAYHEYRVRPGSICHAENSAKVAEASYLAMLGRLDADGFGFRESAVRAALRAALAAKIELNRAFERARLAGEAGNFQEFVARRAR
ncbi:MAG: glycosyltransferase family 2 protein [Alphaproteobacteria bacterium]